MPSSLIPACQAQRISPPAGLPKTPHSVSEPLSTGNTTGAFPRPVTILSLAGAQMLRSGLAL